jgi:hypothetical protein
MSTLIGIAVSLAGLYSFYKGVMGNRDGLAALGAGLFFAGLYVALMM